MFDKVKDILAEQLRLDPDKITPDAEIIADLGADSLDVLQLLMTIEDEYGIKIPDEELEGFHTVGDIVDYVEEHFEE